MNFWTKTAAVLATGLLLWAAPVAAGPKPAPAPGIKRGTPAPMPNPLNLTPAQQKKLQAISMQMKPEFESIMKSGKTDAQRQSAMMALQKKYEPKVMAILSKEQRAKVKAMQADAEKQMKAMRERQKAAPKK